MSFFGFIETLYHLKNNKNQKDLIVKKLNRNILVSSLLENIVGNFDFLLEKNLIKGSRSWITKTYYVLWTGHISTILMKNCFSLKNISKNNTLKEKNKKVEKRNKIIEIGSYICDLPCAVAGTKILPKLFGKNINSGIIGLTGFIAGTSRYYLYYIKNRNNINI